MFVYVNVCGAAGRRTNETLKYIVSYYERDSLLTSFVIEFVWFLTQSKYLNIKHLKI